MATAPEGANDIDRLVAEERLADAAHLAEAAGDADRAIELLSRALLPVEASAVAERAGRGFDAALLAARGGDLPRLARLAAALGEADQRALAARLGRSGAHAAEGTCLSLAGQPLPAGRAFERAGDALAAAACFVEAGVEAEALRVLRAHRAAHPEDDRPALVLARLLAKHGALGEAVAVLAPLGERTEELRRSLLARAARGDRAVSGLLFGRYEVVGPLGTTAAAFVVAARDRVTGRDVAVKLFRGADGSEGRAAIERFFREAEVLRELASPHVVPFVSFHPEGPAVVTELMRGGSLADRLAVGPVGAARTREIAVAVASALEAAHRAGIIHRDVKPANVLFDAAGAPRLADFGAAHTALSGATVTAGLLGTLAYMAPEVRRGEPATPAADVCSLGLVAIEALTGAADGAARLAEGEGRELLAAMTADAPTSRPSIAEARARLALVTLPAAAPASARTTPARVASRRLVPRDDGAFDDVLLGRPVRLVSMDGPLRDRVLAAAARSADDGPLVFRVEAGMAWVHPSRFDRG